jgi:hypothetical protein
VRMPVGRGTRSTGSSWPAGGEGPRAGARCGQSHPCTSTLLRPRRPAAVARGGRRLPRRHDARRPTRRSWIASWPRPTSESAGDATGSTWPASASR